MFQRLNDECYLVTNNQAPFISFSAFENIPGIRAGFSTKLGGVSTGHLKSLNLGFDLGDDYDNILTNYKIISEAIGFDVNDIVLTNQVHKNDVVPVTSNDKGNGLFYKNKFESADGLITDEANLVLTVRGADCTPMFFVDRANRVLATAHGGWAGTVCDIAGNAVRKMTEMYGTRPEDIIAVIGPSICPKCYEISEDVAERFYEKFGRRAYEYTNVDNYVNNRILTPGDDTHYYANLWLANRQNMIDAGVLDENIHNSCLCTKCMMTLFYSHRGMKGRRGVMSGFLFKDY
ncbi:MAG: peptidoglycan editing factor PgeF [Clostridiales bacterium]|nr:peptidoglycan editing factor PgeF [Clostridiales bacterium]